VHQQKRPRHAKRKARPWEKPQIAVFTLTLVVMTVLGLLIPLRPKVSTVENRNLAEFPDFSWDALVSGEYFKGISAWYADTFPLRDMWVEGNNRLEDAYGLPQEDDMGIHGDVQQGDEIPDVPDDTTPSLVLPTAPSTQATTSTTQQIPSSTQQTTTSTTH
jgi:hypothetical protein